MKQQQAITECKRVASETPNKQYYVIRDGRRYSVISFDALIKMERRFPVVYAAIETTTH